MDASPIGGPMQRAEQPRHARGCSPLGRMRIESAAALAQSQKVEAHLQKLQSLTANVLQGIPSQRQLRWVLGKELTETMSIRRSRHGTDAKCDCTDDASIACASNTYTHGVPTTFCGVCAGDGARNDTSCNSSSRSSSCHSDAIDSSRSGNNCEDTFALNEDFSMVLIELLRMAEASMERLLSADSGHGLAPALAPAPELFQQMLLEIGPLNILQAHAQSLLQIVRLASEAKGMRSRPSGESLAPFFPRPCSEERIEGTELTARRSARSDFKLGLRLSTSAPMAEPFQAPVVPKLRLKDIQRPASPSASAAQSDMRSRRTHEAQQLPEPRSLSQSNSLTTTPRTDRGTPATPRDEHRGSVGECSSSRVGERSESMVHGSSLYVQPSHGEHALVSAKPVLLGSECSTSQPKSKFCVTWADAMSASFVYL